MVLFSLVFSPLLYVATRVSLVSFLDGPMSVYTAMCGVPGPPGPNDGVMNHCRVISVRNVYIVNTGCHIFIPLNGQSRGVRDTVSTAHIP